MYWISMLKIIKCDERNKDLNIWQAILCLWIGTLNIVKMSILPKLIYRFNAIANKIQARFSIEIDNLILKLHGKAQALE